MTFHPCRVAGPHGMFQLFFTFLWDGCEHFTRSNGRKGSNGGAVLLPRTKSRHYGRFWLNSTSTHHKPNKYSRSLRTSVSSGLVASNTQSNPPLTNGATVVSFTCSSGSVKRPSIASRHRILKLGCTGGWSRHLPQRLIVNSAHYVRYLPTQLNAGGS